MVASDVIKLAVYSHVMVGVRLRVHVWCLQRGGGTSLNLQWHIWTVTGWESVRTSCNICLINATDSVISEGGAQSCGLTAHSLVCAFLILTLKRRKINFRSSQLEDGGKHFSHKRKRKKAAANICSDGSSYSLQW